MTIRNKCPNLRPQTRTRMTPKRISSGYRDWPCSIEDALTHGYEPKHQQNKSNGIPSRNELRARTPLIRQKKAKCGQTKNAPQDNRQPSQDARPSPRRVEAPGPSQSTQQITQCSPTSYQTED